MWRTPNNGCFPTGRHHQVAGHSERAAPCRLRRILRSPSAGAEWKRMCLPYRLSRGEAVRTSNFDEPSPVQLVAPYTFVASVRSRMVVGV